MPNKPLRDLRKERGGLSRLARYLKLTPAAVSAWPKVPDKYLKKVCKYSDKPADYWRPDLYKGGWH